MKIFPRVYLTNNSVYRISVVIKSDTVIITPYFVLMMFSNELIDNCPNWHHSKIYIYNYVIITDALI